MVSFKLNSPIKILCGTSKNVYFLKSNTLVLYNLEISSDEIHPTPFFKGFLSDAIEIKANSDNSSLILLKQQSVIILSILTSNITTYEHSAPLTALSIQPFNKYIAVGDCIGQIIKIYEHHNSKVHWHAHKVVSIGFTYDGNFMISGGEEGVAVLWHESTGDKTFLPRLGCSIKNIVCSADNDFYIVRLVNNFVKVFRSSDFKEVGGMINLVSPNKMLRDSRVYTGIV